MSIVSVQSSQVSKQQSPSSYPHSAILLESSHIPSPAFNREHSDILPVLVPEVVTDVVVEVTLFPLENTIERSPKNT